EVAQAIAHDSRISRASERIMTCLHFCAEGGERRLCPLSTGFRVLLGGESGVPGSHCLQPPPVGQGSHEEARQQAYDADEDASHATLLGVHAPPSARRSWRLCSPVAGLRSPRW